MKWWRYVPLLGFVRPITAEEYDERRRAKARAAAEDQRRKFIELQDDIDAAVARAEHHKNLSTVYTEQAEGK